MGYDPASGDVSQTFGVRGIFGRDIHFIEDGRLGNHEVRLPQSSSVTTDAPKNYNLCACQARCSPMKDVMKK